MRGGLCGNCYARQRRNGTLVPVGRWATDEERFWAGVAKGGADECWPWTGAHVPAGYGKLRYAGRSDYAHRVSWMIHFGAIPRRLMVRHLVCDNPPCCNPSHLALGTDVENTMDKTTKGRQMRGAAQHRAQLTDDDVRAIRQRALTESRAELASAFGVSRGCIEGVVSRRNWKHVA